MTVLYESDEYASMGEWHDFIVNVNWYSKQGYLNIWLDKNKIVEYQGPIGYNDIFGAYFKMGIYRDDTPETYLLYFDNYKRGFSPTAIDFSK